MEFYAVKALAALIEPPGLFAALLLVCALGARRHPRLTQRLGLLGAALVVLLSTTPVSYALLDSLSHYPPATPPALQRAQAIVILGGGTQYGVRAGGGGTVTPLTLERLRFGARLARQTGLPVLVTEGAPAGHEPGAVDMARALLEWGVAPRWTEGRAMTTFDNARYAYQTLAAAGVTRIALVSHAWHLPRAVALFEQVGFEVIPAPAYVPGPRRHTWRAWLPSMQALELSTLAVHEYLGHAWYRLRYGSGA
ncbi:MAG: YdcF family protein [Immundisolibacter sp.]